MNKDYTGYSAEELLDDDFFVQSNILPTSETEKFWEEQVSSGSLDNHEYQMAIFFLRSVRVKKEKWDPVRQSALWDKIIVANAAQKNNKYHRLNQIIWAAACLLILLASSVSYYLFTKDKQPDMEMIAKSMAPVVDEENIQLILPDRLIPISGQSPSIQHSSEGSVVVNLEQVIETSPASVEEAKSTSDFNQLIVPKGKRSTLVLEDGTSLWVNAGSRVVYPVSFEKKRREIYVDGEVYLDVTHDEKRPFIVRTKDMKVSVLGTSFNVMSYEADQVSAVVLVTGIVEVGTKNEQDCRLSPNEMFSYQNGRSVVKKVDVNDYISWKDGLYTYRSENLSVILDRLSRYYGKKISYESNVANLKCSGKLDMQEELDVILEGLSHTAPIFYKKVDDEYILVKVGE